MRKKINAVLSVVLAITLLFEFALREVSSTMVYSMDSVLDEIMYLGKTLPSSDYVNTAKNSGGIVDGFVKLETTSDNKLLGLGNEGLQKTVYSDVSYNSLTNLMFNLTFMGVKTCEQKFGVSFNGETVQDIISNFLSGDNVELKEAATAVATSLICPAYQATITNFDSIQPVHIDDGVNYYGPFKFSDNTLGFAEVHSNEYISVYKKTKTSTFEEVQYVDSKQSYYVGVKKNSSTFTLALEGVFFQPTLAFFENGLACVGILKNENTVLSLNPVEDATSGMKNGTIDYHVDKIPETVIVYNETGIETVVCDNTSNEIKLDLSDGNYTVESIYENEPFNTSSEEIVVEEGEVLAGDEEEKLECHFGVYDRETHVYVPSKIYIYDHGDNDRFIQELNLTEHTKALELKKGQYKIVISSIASGYEIPEPQIVEFNEENSDCILRVVKGTASYFITFTNNAGQVVEGVSVTLNRDDGRTYVSDEGGIVKFTTLDKGTYTYLVTNVPEEYELPKKQGTFEILAEGTNTTAKIVLETKKFELNVTKGVEGSTDEVKDAVYQIKQQHAPYFTKVISAEEFPITLDVGTYLITEIIPGQGYNFSDPVKQTIEVKKSGIENVRFTTPYQTGTITLRNYTTLGYNDVLEGVSYTLYDLDDEIVSEATSDSKGNVVFENLPLGTYTLQQTDVPSGFVLYKKLVPIKIEDAGEVVSYDSIVAQSVGSITIYHENIAAGVPYYLYNENGKMLNVLYTDSDGVVVFKNLPIGKYEIKTVDNVEKESNLIGMFKPLEVKAYSGIVELTQENLNVAVGNGKAPDNTTNSLGTSKIILSSEVSEYDKSFSGVKDLGTVNVDNISTILSEALPPVDYSGDITKVTIDNTVDSYTEEHNTPVGSDYVADTGVIKLSVDNKTLGDGDFNLSVTEVSGLLNQTVKLPKTGTNPLHDYLWGLTILCLLGLAVNNFNYKRQTIR